MVKRSLECVIREDYNDDPVAYCNRRYSWGPTRWKLQKINYVLWELLNERGLLIHIKTVKSDFGNNSLKCYKDGFLGYTRNELIIAHPGLRKRMYQDGNIRYVPLSRNGTQTSSRRGIKYQKLRC